MTPDALALFVRELLAALGYAPQAVEVSAGQRRVVRVSSPDAQVLIGPNGEHLRAINTLAKRMVEAKLERESPDKAPGKGATDFLIDVGGWHEAQLERVRGQARMLAQRARLFKHNVDLPAMSAYERLVVHELFSEDPEIKTESAGEGKFRHIVLKYKA